MQLSKGESDRRVTLMYHEFYEGDGKENPPMVTRMQRIEDAIASLKTVKWLLAGAIITAVFNIISAHVKF